MYYISDRRRTTYPEIAAEFNIGFNTARRDVELLMCSYPIEAVKGKGGGIRAMDGWYASRRYMTDKQEYLLRQLLTGLQPDDQKTMEGILAAFAKPQIKEDVS
jgi:predicted DNA-binding transcriptional regulator YafY